MSAEIEKIEAEIETAIGELYRGFYRLRKLEAYQEEYENMDALMNMLMQDRMHLLKKYNINL